MWFARFAWFAWFAKKSYPNFRTLILILAAESIVGSRTYSMQTRTYIRRRCRLKYSCQLQLHYILLLRTTTELAESVIGRPLAMCLDKSRCDSRQTITKTKKIPFFTPSRESICSSWGNIRRRGNSNLQHMDCGHMASISIIFKSEHNFQANQ